MKGAPFISLKYIFSFVSFFGGAIALSACCGDDSYPRGHAVAFPRLGGDCLGNGAQISIEEIHSPNHAFTIPAGDIAAMVGSTYTLLDNGSGHTHEVTVTVEDFQEMQANQGIQETSTLAAGHVHLVTLNCL